MTAQEEGQDPSAEAPVLLALLFFFLVEISWGELAVGQEGQSPLPARRRSRRNSF
ncbi:MAG: hypothetical protein AAF718_09820 [Pseudomonadota bacterium]